MRLIKRRTVFTKKTLFFLKKGRLNSHENASIQRKVQNHNENKLLFY